MMNFSHYVTHGQTNIKLKGGLHTILYDHQKKENIQLNNTLNDVNNGLNEWEIKYLELQKKVRRQKKIIKEVDQIQNEKKRLQWEVR